MDSIYQLLSNALPNGTWSSPAWFNGSLYYGGVSDSLKAYAFSNGSFSLASRSTNIFSYPGTTPAISADGTSNGIVWAADNLSPAVLHAYDATDVSKELYNSGQAANSRDHFGNGNKFIVPTIANGKVYVGTTNGVGVFGLLSKPSLTISKTHSGNFTQGQQGATYTVAVSNAAGAGETSGSVTVTETVPVGMTLAGMSGTGWSCAGNTCSRIDDLGAGASYQPITVTVNVANSAASSVTNTVTVAGGGDTGGIKTANDLTTINSQTVTLTINIAPAGGGTVTPASGMSFVRGAVANLQATPSAGYSFIDWTGSVANPNSAESTITLNSAQTVTANFSPGATTLGGAITGKSGPSNARQWAFGVINNGPGAANAALLTGFTLSQSGGPACTPVVSGSFPLPLGNLAPNGSTTATVTTDFSACAASARFTLQVGISANGGAAVGSVTRANQFQ